MTISLTNCVIFLQMDTGIDAAGNSEDASASFGDTEGTDQFTGVAIKGTLLNFNEISI